MIERQVATKVLVMSAFTILALYEIFFSSALMLSMEKQSMLRSAFLVPSQMYTIFLKDYEQSFFYYYYYCPKEIDSNKRT